MQKEKHNYLNIFIILFIVSLALLVYLIFSLPVESKVFEVKFIVGENIGVDTNNSAIVFGRVVPGSVSTRKIFIDNKYDFPIVVKSLPSKNIENFLRVNPDFALNAGRNYSLPVELVISDNVSLGEYRGTLTVRIFKNRR